jgi:transcriptional regulator with XRE-family HTH domain
MTERIDLTGTLSQMESGKTRRVDLDLLERLAKALGIPPAKLIVGTTARAQRPK